MKEKVMTKNYKKTFIILLIFELLLGAVTGVAIPLSLRTQISEASVLREQARQQYEKDIKTYGAAAVGDWDEYEDNYDSQWHSQLTPLNAANYAVIGVLGSMCAIVLIIYWITVAEWLYKSAAVNGMNPSLWAILGAFFNFLAVLAFLIARDSPGRRMKQQT